MRALRARLAATRDMRELVMARALWSGSINFGLVNIPVRLHTAVREREVHFHMLAASDHCRLRRRMVCPADEREVPTDEVVRGYEVAPDQYVVVEDEELKRLRPEATRSIDIRDFVDLSEIDPVYYDRPYYVVPDERGAKPYRLLLEAMTQSNKVAIANFVMRQKEYLVALRPLENILCLSTMRFADEVVPVSSLNVPAGKLDKRELEVANRLVDALITKFDPEKYHNEYRDRIMALLEKKAAGEEIKLPPPPEKPGRVINLMEALQQSLAQQSGARTSRARKPRAPSRARKTGGRRRKAS